MPMTCKQKLLVQFHELFLILALKPTSLNVRAHEFMQLTLLEILQQLFANSSAAA
jgi:hypothetical protein